MTYNVFSGTLNPTQSINPKTSILSGGKNTHYLANLVKYQRLHITETTALIPTKFCTVISTAKYYSSVVQPCS